MSSVQLNASILDNKKLNIIIEYNNIFIFIMLLILFLLIFEYYNIFIMHIYYSNNIH